MTTVARWLDVEVGTNDIELNTLPSNVALVDIYNDNEIKLIVGDLGRGKESPKLKIFRGAMQISDMVLPDLPHAVVGFYPSDSVPRSIPFLAIAFSTCVYVYRNMKLFYKYYLPSTELNMSEVDLWKQLIDSTNHNTGIINSLTENLKNIPEDMLSIQSKNFIKMTSEQQLEYLEHNSVLPSRRTSEIVCVTTMKMNSVDKHAVSCLVVGTEDGDVIFLDPINYTPLSQAKLYSVKRTPYQMISTGLYTVEFRLTVATREKSVFLLKREWREGRLLFATDDHIVAIEVMTNDFSVVVICADNTMTCYSKKGKKQWSVTLEHRPVAMTLVPIVHLGLTLTAVALASGHLHFYEGKARRDTIFVRDVVSAMKFGQLGQEEHVLTMVTGGKESRPTYVINAKDCDLISDLNGTQHKEGNLVIKILKRTADFNTHAAGVESSVDSIQAQRPWLIPKKSKLFLEQSVRERENAAAMHESFQLELNKLRLTAAKTLLEAHMKSDNSIGIGTLEPIRLSAEVEGMGPVFRMTLSVENTSTEKAVIGLSILFHVDPRNYKVSQPYIKVPLIAPSNKLRFPTKIEEVFDENINPEVFFRPVTGEGGERSIIKILLLKESKTTPVLAATVQMPPTDPIMLPFDKLETATGFGTGID